MKRWSFFSTLLTGNLLLLGIIVVVGFVAMQRMVDQKTAHQTEVFQSQLLNMIRQDIEKAWPQADARIAQSCRSVSEMTGVRLTVIDRQGHVLGDSAVRAEDMVPHNTSNRPEIVDALSGRSGHSVRTSETMNLLFRYFAEPVRYEGEVVAVVRIAFPVSDITGFSRRIVSDIVMGLAFVLFVAVALFVLFSWIWYRPIAQINRIARNISQGDLGDFFLVSGPREMTELAKSIDQMRKTVASQLATITRQQERFRVILYYLPDAVFALNRKDEVLFCNESAKKLFRLDPPTQPHHIQQLIRHANILDYYFRNSVYLRTASAGTTLERLELEWQGQKHILDLELLDVPGGPGADEITVLLVISDVTALLRTSQIKVDFVANASHELRTPLATIRAALDNVNDGMYDDVESLLTVFQILNRQVARLESLIEDLLSLQSVEDKSIPLREKTSAEEQRLWLDELFRPKAVENDIGLSFDWGENLPPFLTDNKRLGLILQNLVDNALKFTPSRGKVTVRFARDGDSRLVIICSDTGCGIASYEQDRVFERFYQSDSSRTGDNRVRGTGLGLAIVKHAVERLKGTVTLTSRLGFGTTMTVHIPVEFCQEQAGTTDTP